MFLDREFAEGRHCEERSMTIPLPNRLRVVRATLPLALCALIQGCVGGGVVWTKTESCQNPDLADLQGGKLHAYDEGATNVVIYTPAWLQTNWGKPKSIQRTGTGGTNEIWTYKYDWNWNGAVVCVLLPIPLELPVGREWTKLVIEDGHVTSATRRFTRTSGGIIGYSCGPCGINDFGVHSLSY